MTAPGFVYLVGEGEPEPDVKRPEPPEVCDVDSPEDPEGEWYRCDLNAGHDGPHAAFHHIGGALLAVWGEAP